MSGWANTAAHSAKVTVVGSTGTSITGFSTSNNQIIALASLWADSGMTPTFSDTTAAVASFATASTLSDVSTGVTLGITWGVSAGGTCTPKVTWADATSTALELYAGAFTTPGGVVSQDGTTGTATGTSAAVTTPIAAGTSGINDLVVNIVGFGNSYASNGGAWTPMWDASTGDFCGFAINAAGNLAPNVTQSPSGVFASMTLALKASGVVVAGPSVFSVSDPAATRIPGIH